MRRPDYGLDAPVVLRRLIIVGGLSLGLALAMPRLRWLSAPGLWFLVCAGVMVWGSRIGKLRLRDRLMAAIPWRGDERVLDVGCGRGLLAIGAAKRLTTGKAIGVDVWSGADQARNSPRATLENARLEGVADRLAIQTADARKLPFADGAFDVVVSSFALYNIPAPAGREAAIREIVRVLRPGGRVAVADVWKTREYARLLRACGLADVRRSGPSFIFVVPAFVLTAVAQRPNAVR